MSAVSSVEEKSFKNLFCKFCWYWLVMQWFSWATSISQVYRISMSSWTNSSHYLWRYNVKYTCWCEILDRLCNACTFKRAFEPWFGTLAFQLAVESIHGQPISTEMYVSTRPQLPNYSTASKIISISFAVGLLVQTSVTGRFTKVAENGIASF